MVLWLAGFWACGMGGVCFPGPSFSACRCVSCGACCGRSVHQGMCCAYLCGEARPAQSCCYLVRAPDCPGLLSACCRVGVWLVPSPGAVPNACSPALCFYCSSQCCVAQEIPLTSVGQLSQLCPLPAPRIPPPPHW